MPKSVELQNFLDTLFPHKEGQCPTCLKPIGEFKDDLSRKEFKISGMCQECQDSVFEED